MNDTQVKQFGREGFLILRGAIPESSLDALRMALFVMARKGEPGRVDQSLSDVIEMLEKRNHGMVYTLQKAIATSFTALQVLTDLKLASLHSQLYDVPEANVHTHLFQTPIQFPGDQRYDFSWHQESGSYSHTSKILTCWFPVLGPVNRERGSTELIPGSHVHGKREARHHVKDSGLNDWTVMPEPDELRRSVIAEMKPGDILLFDSDLVHRSVANCSKSIRITGIARTVDICGGAEITALAEPGNYFEKTMNRDLSRSQVSAPEERR